MPSFRDVLATLMDSYFIVDEERRLTDQNRSFLELSGGRHTAKRAGVAVHCYDRLKLELCPEDCIALRAIKAGRTVEVSEIHGQSSDGRPLVLVGRATPLREDDGSLSGVLVAYRDVTEETGLREKLHRIEKESREEKDMLLKTLSERVQEIDHLRRQLDGGKHKDG